MALDESVSELDELESNGITAHIDPSLKETLQTHGEINIDYVDHPDGRGSGYMIQAGKPGDCSNKGCAGC